MKPGRLPTNHPLEQAARDKLRQPSPEARAKLIEQAQGQPATTHVVRELARAAKRRWQ